MVVSKCDRQSQVASVILVKLFVKFNFSTLKLRIFSFWFWLVQVRISIRKGSMEEHKYEECINNL